MRKIIWCNIIILLVSCSSSIEVDRVEKSLQLYKLYGHQIILMKNINESYYKLINDRKDQGAVTKANLIRLESRIVYNYIDSISRELVIKGGGTERFAFERKMDSESIVKKYLLGNFSSKGESENLKRVLNNFTFKIIDLNLDLNLDLSNIAVNGNEHFIYKKDKDYNQKDFGHLFFEKTNILEALIILEYYEQYVALIENNALSQLLIK